MRHLGIIALLFATFARAGAAELRVGPGEAHATIQGAVDALPARLAEPHVIHVAPGVYREEVVIRGVGSSPENPLILRGAGAGSVIDAEGKRPHGIRLERQQYVVIEDLAVLNGASHGNIFLLNTARIGIRRCVLSGNRKFDALTLSGAVDTEIEHCVLAGSARAGLFLINSSHNTVARFNIFHGNAIAVRMSAQHPGAPFTLNHNAFFANKSDFENVPADPRALHADPRFRDAAQGDFHLLPDSPCPRWGPSGQATPDDPRPGARPSAPPGGASANAPIATDDLRPIDRPGGFFLLSLAGVANAALADETASDRQGGWTDQGDWDMRHLPRGVQTLRGIPFRLPDDAQAPSVLVLKGQKTPWRPEKAEGIPVDRSTDRLYFLHACAWAAGGDVAVYRVHYADGQRLDIPIRFRVEIADWYAPADLDNLKVAWKGENPNHPNVELGLYSHEWINPRPFSPIRAIDAISTGLATPILVAVTGRETPESSRGRVALSVARGGEDDAPLTLNVDFSSRDHGDFLLRATLLDESGNPVADEVAQRISLAPGAHSARARLDFARPRPGVDTNYRFVLNVFSGDRPVATETAYYPAKADRPVLADLHFDPARPMGGDNIFYGSEVQPAIRIHRAKFAQGERPRRIDPAIFDTLKANGGTIAHLVCWWSYLEPEPYRYDFSDIEYALEQCRRVGLKASISVWMGDHNIPTFCQDENMLDQEGRPFLDSRGTNTGYGFHPSLWGPKSRRHFAALIREIGRTYLDRDDIAAWAFLYQHIEVTLHDKVGDGLHLYDYSPWAEENFRRYLRETRGFALADLNARYSSDFVSWGEVTQPKPREGMDVSLRWNDFQDFRVYSIRDIFAFIFDQVRAMDPEGRKAHFTFNPLFAEDLCVRYGVAIDSTGSEYADNADKFSRLRLYAPGHPLIVEPINIPPDLYELRSGYFNALAAPAQGYLWVGTDRHGLPRDTAAAAVFRDLRHAWTALSAARTIPPRIATLSSYDSVHAEEKIISHSRRRDNYQALLRLFQRHQFAWQTLDDGVLERGDYRFPHEYRILIDDDSVVMREALMRRLVSAVEEGATLVMHPRTGLLCRENPIPEASLAARFGLSRPVASGSSNAWDAETVRFGKGRIIRFAEIPDWSAADAEPSLLRLLDEAEVGRPVQAAAGIRAALLTDGKSFFVPLFNESATRHAAFALTLPGLPSGPLRRFRVDNADTPDGMIEGDFRLILAPHELRVYRFAPVQ